MEGQVRARQADTDVSDNRAGESIAETWGGSYYLWQYTLSPRLGPFLPAESVALIGANAAALAVLQESHCRRLVVVDNETTPVNGTPGHESTPRSWHVDRGPQDRSTLESVDDESLDLAVALAEVSLNDRAILPSLLATLATKLRRDGVGFLFHRIAAVDCNRLGGRLRRRFRWPGRRPAICGTAGCVSARRFGQLAAQAELRCLSQELVAWRSDKLTDCFSVFCRRDARWAREHRVLRNHGFREEIARIRQLSMSPDTLPLDCRVPPEQTAARFRYVKAA